MPLLWHIVFQSKFYVFLFHIVALPDVLYRFYLLNPPEYTLAPTSTFLLFVLLRNLRGWSLSFTKKYTITGFFVIAQLYCEIGSCFRSFYKWMEKRKKLLS